MPLSAFHCLLLPSCVPPSALNFLHVSSGVPPSVVHFFYLPSRVSLFAVDFDFYVCTYVYVCMYVFMCATIHSTHCSFMFVCATICPRVVSCLLSVGHHPQQTLFTISIRHFSYLFPFPTLLARVLSCRFGCASNRNHLFPVFSGVLAWSRSGTLSVVVVLACLMYVLKL